MWGLFLLWYVGSLLQNVGSLSCSTLDLLVVACRIFLVVVCVIFVVARRILVAACGGHSLVAVRRVLIVVVSLVTEHGL